MAFLVGILLALFVVDGVWEWVVIAAGGAIEIGESWFWLRWTHRDRPIVGVEALSGSVVEVDENGRARLAGERWRVRGAMPGEHARVVSVDGLTLVVEKIES